MSSCLFEVKCVLSKPSWAWCKWFSYLYLPPDQSLFINYWQFFVPPVLRRWGPLLLVLRLHPASIFASPTLTMSFSIPVLSSESLQVQKHSFSSAQLLHLPQDLHVYSGPFQFLVNQVSSHDVLQWFSVCISYLSNESIRSFRARNCTIFLSIHCSTKQQRGILINTVLNWIKYIEPASYFNKFIDKAGHQRLLYTLCIILPAVVGHSSSHCS